MANDYSHIQGDDFYHVAQEPQGQNLADGITQGLKAFADIRKGIFDKKEADKQKEILENLQGKKERQADEKHADDRMVKKSVADKNNDYSKSLLGKKSRSGKSKGSGTGYTLAQANSLRTQALDKMMAIEGDETLRGRYAGNDKNKDERSNVKDGIEWKVANEEYQKFNTINENTINYFNSLNSGESTSTPPQAGGKTSLPTNLKENGTNGSPPTVKDPVEVKDPVVVEAPDPIDFSGNLEDAGQMVEPQVERLGLSQAQSPMDRFVGSVGIQDSQKATAGAIMDKLKIIGRRAKGAWGEYGEDAQQWAQGQSGSVNALVRDDIDGGGAQGVKNILSDPERYPEEMKALNDSITYNESPFLTREGVNAVMSMFENKGMAKETDRSDGNRAINQARKSNALNMLGNATGRNDAIESAVKEALANPEQNEKLIRSLLDSKELPDHHRKELEKLAGGGFMSELRTSGPPDEG